MSNNKQSSVDYLINELNRIQELYYGQSIIPIEVITKAKAMHKEEIINSYCDGRLSVVNKQVISAEQYYNKTYNNEQQ